MSEPFIGEIRMVAFNYAPYGWAFCDGSVLPLAQNQALFALLGTQFGGNGQTNFGLPDLRSRSPIGYSQIGMAGAPQNLTPFVMAATGGVETCTLEPANVPVPPHTHGATAVVAQGAATTSTPSNSTLIAAAADNGAGVTYSNFAPAGGATTALASDFVTVSAVNSTNPPPAAIPTRSPFLAVNFIIALVGVFPPHQ